MPEKPLLGAHFSTAGSLTRAVKEAEDLGCNVIQLFTKNARTWQEKALCPDDIRAFKTARKEAGIAFAFSHCTYLINVAADTPDKLSKSATALASELLRSASLGLDGVILHPGSHLGAGVEAGIEKAAKTLNQVFDQIRDGILDLVDAPPRLLIETTAGQGTGLGHRFEQIADLLSRIENAGPAGVCLDTSHIFAAGYDLREPDAVDNTLAAFNDTIDLNRLFAIHLNDSRSDLGSRVDRHQHIGKGHIGQTGFRSIMTDPRLANIPKILETPKESDGIPMDPVNLDLLRRFYRAN